MKVGPKSSLRPFLHRAPQMFEWRNLGMSELNFIQPAIIFMSPTLLVFSKDQAVAIITSSFDYSIFYFSLCPP